MVLAIFVALASLVRGQAEPANIMPLGDSITRGTNDVNYPNSDIPGGYRKNLQARLAGGGFTYNFVGTKTDNSAPGMDPDHNGTNGIRTDQVLANLSAWMAVQPDTVLMLLGTNDILQGVQVTTAANNLSTLIDRITTGFPQRRLYVSTVLPISGKDWNGQTAATLNNNANSYNTQVRNLVQQYRNTGRNVTLVDMNSLLVYTNTDPSKNVFQPGDGVHPGQAGYDQMGDIWHNAITATGSLLDPPQSTYDSWAVAYPAFLTLSAAERAPSADPNKDSITNLVSYALALDPLSGSASASLPSLTPEPGSSSNLIFSFRHNKLATDVVIKVLISSDLSTGSWTIQSQAGATATDLGGNVERIDVPVPILSGNTRKFARLEVTKTSP